jgi:hypothetical protein
VLPLSPSDDLLVQEGVHVFCCVILDRVSLHAIHARAMADCFLLVSRHFSSLLSSVFLLPQNWSEEWISRYLDEACLLVSQENKQKRVYQDYHHIGSFLLVEEVDT